jgi:hypothetical protein
VIKKNKSTKVPIRLYELALYTKYKELAKNGHKRTKELVILQTQGAERRILKL